MMLILSLFLIRKKDYRFDHLDLNYSTWIVALHQLRSELLSPNGHDKCLIVELTFKKSSSKIPFVCHISITEFSSSLSTFPHFKYLIHKI
jgi:hypothetical protein